MPETVTYKQVGDCALQLDVYPSERPGPSPVVLWLHGGALMFGDRTLGAPTSAIRQRCAEVGIATVAIDYRLAPETKLPHILADVLDAVWWLQQEGHRFNLDGARFAVLGQSAGGYLALLLGGWSVPPPKAVVSLYGYGDVTGAWYTTPSRHYTSLPAVTEDEARAALSPTPLSAAPLDFTLPLTAAPRYRLYLYTRQQGCWPDYALGVSPQTHPEAFAPYCPVRQVTAAYPPTLLLHGTADTDVPCAESLALAAVLQGVGVPHQLVTVPEADHVFDLLVTPEAMAAPEPSAAAQACTTAVAFLSKYLG